MVIAENNKTRENEFLPGGLPGQEPAVAAVDRQLLLDAGPPPLTTYTLQRALSLAGNGYGGPYSWPQTVRLPLSAGTFDYIFSRTELMPSAVFRKLDLPWLGLRRAAGQDHAQSASVSGIREIARLHAAGYEVDTSLSPPGDAVAGGPEFQAADETPPAMNGKAASPPLSAEKPARKVPAPPVPHSASDTPTAVNREPTAGSPGVTAAGTSETTGSSSEIRPPGSTPRTGVGAPSTVTNRQSRPIQRQSTQPSLAATDRAGETPRAAPSITAPDSPEIVGQPEPGGVSATGSQLADKIIHRRTSPDVAGTPGITAKPSSLPAAPRHSRTVEKTIVEESHGSLPAAGVVKSPEVANVADSGIVSQVKMAPPEKPVSGQSMESPEKETYDRVEKAPSGQVGGYDDISLPVIDAGQSPQAATGEVPDGVSRDESPTPGKPMPGESMRSPGKEITGSIDRSPLQTVGGHDDVSLPVIGAGQSPEAATGVVPGGVSRDESPTPGKPVAGESMRSLGKETADSIDKAPSAQSALRGSTPPETVVTSPDVAKTVKNIAPLSGSISRKTAQAPVSGKPVVPDSPAAGLSPLSEAPLWETPAIDQKPIPMADAAPEQHIPAAGSTAAGETRRAAVTVTESPPLDAVAPPEKPVSDTVAPGTGIVSDAGTMSKRSAVRTVPTEGLSFSPVIVPRISGDMPLKRVAQRTAAQEGVGVLPHRGVTEQSGETARDRANGTDSVQSPRQELPQAADMPLLRETDGIPYERDTRGTVAPDGAVDDGGLTHISAGKQTVHDAAPSRDSRSVPLQSRTGSIADRIVTASRRISRTAGAAPVLGQSGMRSPDSGFLSLAADYQPAGRQLLELPVVSAARPAEDAAGIPAGEIARAAAGSGFSSAQPGTGAGQSSTMVRRMIGTPISAGATIVEQQADDSEESAPDIRVLAEKVFALLKRELKIERERDRHQRLR